MREIKYRAWDNEKRFMFVPTQIELSQGENFSRWEEWKPMAWRDELPEEGSGGIGRFIGTECEIMQYTGLKDRNGKEIYEGDIAEDDLNSLGLVFYEDGSFKITSTCNGNSITNKNVYDLLDTSLIEDNNISVIGNIYEHPHLLEGDSV